MPNCHRVGKVWRLFRTYGQLGETKHFTTWHQTTRLENARQASIDSQKSYQQDIPLMSKKLKLIWCFTVRNFIH